MPLYELYLVSRAQPDQPALRDLMRRVGGAVLSQGCAVRKIEFLGTRTLPYRMKTYAQRRGVGYEYRGT